MDSCRWNFGSQDSMVSIVTILLSGLSRVWILVEIKRFFFSSKCPNQSWGPPSVLFKRYLGSSLVLRRLGHEVNHWHYLLLSLDWTYTSASHFCLLDVYSDLLRAGQSGDWITVWALHFLHQTRLSLWPIHPAVQLVQVFFAGDKAARAGVHGEILGAGVAWSVWWLPPPGWSMVQILVGKNIFLFSKMTRWLWVPPSLLTKGYQVSLLGLKQPWCEVNGWRPCSTEVRVELYIYSPFRPSWHAQGKLYFLSWFIS